MVKKVWKKYEKSCDGLPSSPKSKRGGQAFGILAISTTPIFWGLWGHFHVMCAQLRPVGTTTSLGSVRRLPTRSAAPVSLDRPPLSPRLSARWTQCDDHLLRDHVRERCGQGERRRPMHLTRSGLAPGWPPWWKRLRKVIFSFSDHFCLIFSWKGRYPRPYTFFHKKTKRSSFQRYISLTLNDSWTARSKEPAIEKGTFPLLKKLLFHFGE